MDSARWQRAMVICMAIAVAAIYASPLAVWYFHHDRLLVAVYFDDLHYSARIVDAYRGGSVASPFLAGHEQAADYMPQMTERAIAGAAHVLRISPLGAIAASRVIFPLAIFWLLFCLARNLQIPATLAALAGGLATLGSLRWGFAVNDPAPFFPRYFRTVSPAGHVTLMLLAMLLLEIVSREPSGDPGREPGREPGDAGREPGDPGREPSRDAGREPPRDPRVRVLIAVFTGVTLGLLFYVPLYYWSTVLAGAAWLTWRARGEARRDLLIALLIATAFAIPYARRSMLLVNDPDVADTLARFGLMTPGRSPEPDVLPPFFAGLAIVTALFFWRGRLDRWGRPAAFLLPFLIASTCFLQQNIVTNRDVQAHHWIDCLVPCASLGIAALWSAWPSVARPAIVAGAAALLVIVAGSVAVIAGSRLVSVNGPPPKWYEWNLLVAMPETVAWLDRSTPPQSVVVSSDDIMSALVLFTRNKVYGSSWATQHTLSSAEDRQRAEDLTVVDLGGQPSLLRYRADFFLGHKVECSGDVVYRNPVERTCVVSLRNLTR